jgi:hypothetical protein
MRTAMRRLIAVPASRTRLMVWNAFACACDRTTRRPLRQVSHQIDFTLGDIRMPGIGQLLDLIRAHLLRRIVGGEAADCRR